MPRKRNTSRASLGSKLRFVSDVEEAKNSETKGFRFAKRNQAFRNGGDKPLKSLRVANHDFAASSVFNELSAISFRRFLTIGFSRLKDPREQPEFSDHGTFSSSN
jgi:hypothetical protein